MRSLIFAATLLAAVLGGADAAQPKWTELTGYSFQKYSEDFGRNYKGEEFDLRKSIFDAELKTVQAHNADNSQTWKMGMNQFSDWSVEEKKSYNTYKQQKHLYEDKVTTYKSGRNANSQGLPALVDYRTWTAPRVLTGVKNQGACGGCWGFSATETMESQFAMLTGQLPVLSAQQIVSCTTFGMQGCGGGDYFAAWMYVAGTTGLNEEWLYPFTDFFAPNETLAGTAKCENITKHFLPNFPWYPKAGIPNHNSALVQVETNNASALMEALALVGPQSISVAAAPWMSYEGGIFVNNASLPSNVTWGIDHAVQCVGYGHDFDNGMDYWIVRNSWGTNWGEDGFIRLSRPKVEPCGTVPQSGGQKACGTSGILSQPGYPQVMTLAKKNT